MRLLVLLLLLLLMSVRPGPLAAPVCMSGWTGQDVPLLLSRYPVLHMSMKMVEVRCTG